MKSRQLTVSSHREKFTSEPKPIGLVFENFDRDRVVYQFITGQGADSDTDLTFGFSGLEGMKKNLVEDYLNFGLV